MLLLLPNNQLILNSLTSTQNWPPADRGVNDIKEARYGVPGESYTKLIRIWQQFHTKRQKESFPFREKISKVNKIKIKRTRQSSKLKR